MRFAFTLLDHRVSLSIDKYAAPAVTFEDTLQAGNLIPPLTRYSDFFSGSSTTNFGGSDYLIEVDEGATYEWIKKGNDLGIGDSSSTPLVTSGNITARPFVVKVTVSDAEMTAWDGDGPDAFSGIGSSLDGVTVGVGDLFLIQRAENFGGNQTQNGIFKIRDAAGHFDPIFSGFSNGMTVRVMEGATGAGKYFRFQAQDVTGPLSFWVPETPGKVFLRLTGAAGVLVTAGLKRVP